MSVFMYTYEKEYYYCSSKIKFPKSEIFDLVLSLFKTKNANVLDFEEIYTYLQEALNVHSVNRNNLKLLLKATLSNKVVFQTVQTEASIYIEGQKTEENTTSVREKLSTLKELTLMIGLENIIELINMDGIKLNGILAQLNPSIDFLSDKFSDFRQFKNYNKLLDYDEKKKNLIVFLNNVEEKKLLYLLEDENRFYEEYIHFFQKERERKKEENFFEKVKLLMANIHNDNLCIRANFFFNKEMLLTLNRNADDRISDLQKTISDDVIISIFHSSLADYFLEVLNKLQESKMEAIREGFKDLLLFKHKSGKPNAMWERDFKIINRRSVGETLSNAGLDYGLTRERVRQIERKYEQQFRIFYNNADIAIMSFMHAFSNSRDYISLQEIKRIFGQYSNIFGFFLKQFEEDDLDFIPELNIFSYRGIIDWYEETIKLANSLPMTISVEQINKKIEELTKAFNELSIDVSYEYVETIIKSDYQLNGSIYSRTKLSFAQKYMMVLKKFFPDGICVYEKKDMDRFRECYGKMFEDVGKLPENDHAISSRITAVTILCDKGRYAIKEGKLISSELLADICKYIDTSNKEIFLMNTLFYVFEDRLISEGIDNKYYLQGILHEKLPNKYFFSRDYVSKTKEISSVGPAILRFVENARAPVTRESINCEFVGVPNSVISFSLQNENIISGFNIYIHKSFILNQTEKVEQLKEVIDNLVLDGEIHNSEELMSILSLMHRDLLTALGVDSRYLLFSIIETVFKNDYSLSRPFFAKKGTIIGRQDERIRDFLLEQDIVEISDFMDYVRENGFIVNNILMQLNSLNDLFLLKDRNSIIKISLTGINKYKAEYVDDFIDDLIGEDGVLVLNNQNYSLLPRINILWNDWLVYSVINKWSKKYKVTTTNNQFRLAQAVVFKAEMDADNINDLIEKIKEERGYNEAQTANFMRRVGLI